MDTVALIFQGDRPTKGTVLASVLVFVLAAGTIIIAAFLLISVFRDMSSVRTKRRLRELEPGRRQRYVNREPHFAVLHLKVSRRPMRFHGLPKALTVRRNKTKSTLPGFSTRPTIFRTFNVRRNVPSNYSPVSVDLTSTRTVPPKDPNARRSHTSRTSILYRGGGELSEARITHTTASYESISTYGGREDSSTTSVNRSDADVTVASTLIAARDDKEAPHKISWHRTSLNKVPRSVRNGQPESGAFSKPQYMGLEERRTRIVYMFLKLPSMTPHIVLFQSTTAAILDILNPFDNDDLVVTHRHKRHRHGRRPVSIPKGTEQTHKIHGVTTVHDKRPSVSPHSTSIEPSTQMSVNASVEATSRDRTSRAAATVVSSSSTEANKYHRITGAASPASSSNRTQPIHAGSIPVTSSDSTPTDSAKDVQTTRAISSTTNMDHEDPNADATNYSRSTEAATNASSKNDTHPSHFGSVPHESTNLKEKTLRHDLHTTEETYARKRDQPGSTERKSLESEEPFTEEDGADVSKTTKHIHEAFRLDISRTPSSTRDRANHSTHKSHVRRIRTSTSPTTGPAEEKRNGSQPSSNADAEASSTLYGKSGTSFQTAPSTHGTKLSSEPRTLSGDDDDSGEHSSHVFVGPGNWNDLAKDDEDGHTHGHVPIPDPDGAKAATVGFPLNVFNRVF
ncbi:hypothetical protein MTO96_049563 [Rhipicephalus appendiculatus]